MYSLKPRDELLYLARAGALAERELQGNQPGDEEDEEEVKQQISYKDLTDVHHTHASLFSYAPY